MDREVIEEINLLHRKLITLETRFNSMEYLANKRAELVKKRREKIISMTIALAIALIIVFFALYVPQASKIDTQGNEAVIGRQVVEEMQISEQELRMELGE